MSDTGSEGGRSRGSEGGVRDGGEAATEAVREALCEVVDPCSASTGSNLDIVEMGLVKGVDVDGGRVTVDMRLTTPACTMVPYFVREVEDRVGALSGVDSVELETDAGFEWSEEMLTDEARERRRAALDERRRRYREEAETDGGARTETAAE